ncbi:MAG: hypothetical protein A4E60_03487 [Syntrophorhabdus sp. PtaB.Bin047]|nr:MAG: hypothetical protein A4E60_03487 [Syntrophorhabdus sp. PtaB.Bin047]
MPAAVAANPFPFMERAFILTISSRNDASTSADRLFFRKVLFFRDAVKEPSIRCFSGRSRFPFTSMLRSPSRSGLNRAGLRPDPVKRAVSLMSVSRDALTLPEMEPPSSFASMSASSMVLASPLSFAFRSISFQDAPRFPRETVPAKSSMVPAI